MDEYRIRITAGHGYTEADAEKLLDAALRRAPNDGPVTSLDLEPGDVSLTVSRDAPSARHAIEYGDTLMQIVFKTAELNLHKIIALEVELAEADHDHAADETLTAPA